MMKNERTEERKNRRTKELKFISSSVLLFIRFLVLPFLSLTLLTSGFYVNATLVGSTDDAMTIGGGARPIGMGRAFTAIADDADAPFINPAGIAGIKGPQVMAMYTNLLNEVYYREFSGAVPTPFGTFGMGYITTGVNNIPTGALSTDYYDSLLLATFSVPLARYFNYGNNIFVGANYKIYNRGYVGGINNIATGMSADLGLKYVHSPNLSFGLCRQNFIPVSMGGVVRLSGGAEESLASITKLGIAIRPAFQPSLLLALDNDIPEQTGRPATLHLGVEWKAIEYLTLRAGLDQSVDPTAANRISTNPSVGTSFGVGGIRIDYAYHAYYNDASLATHYVSLSYTGEPWFALKGRIE